MTTHLKNANACLVLLLLRDTQPDPDAKAKEPNPFTPPLDIYSANTHKQITEWRG
jgi:hypothetical protein